MRLSHRNTPSSPGNPAQPGRVSLRTLVTGGAGFIGSHLVEHLVARGDAVTVVDDLSTGIESNLDAVRDRVNFIRSDLAAAIPVLATLPPFDRVYHLAAAVGVDLVLTDPDRKSVV